MSRLDNSIRRLEVQRVALDRAISLARDIAGPVFELGLGNGRTFDHLREHLSGREIFAFEMLVSAHPDSMPDTGHIIVGDLRETLPRAAERFARQVALLHMDVASHYWDRSLRFAAALAPLIRPLMCPGGIVVSELPLPAHGLEPLPLPPGIEPGRYCLYRAAGGPAALG